MENFFIVFVLFIIQIQRTITQEFNITFDPPLIRGLSQWDTAKVTFKIDLLNSNQNKSVDNDFELILDIQQSPDSPRSVIEFAGLHTYTKWNENLYKFRITESQQYFSSDFTIKGLFLGYSNISFKISYNETVIQMLDNYTVSVVRKPSIFDLFFGIIIISLVTINYVNMGCHMDLEIVKQTLKMPIGPLIGFVCQFTIMPLASYLIGWLFLDDISLRLGLFTLGCSPGGNSSNFWTLLFNGDVNLSITMTFISTIAALVMMPFWLFTLGRTLFSKGNIRIPYLNLFSSLITLTFPMVIGIAIRHYRPNWAEFSQKIIKPFTIVVVIFGIVGSALLYNHIFIMFTWPIVITGALVALSGYSLGAITAALIGMKRPQIIAISIETAYQNGGIAFLLLILSLQQPDADIASVPCIAQLILTGQPLWLVFIGIKIYKYLNPKEVTNKSIGKVSEEVNKNTDLSIIGIENNCYVSPLDEKQENIINSNQNIDLENDRQITKF